MYFHKIPAHGAIQNRIISGKSCHAEECNVINQVIRDQGIVEQVWNRVGATRICSDENLMSVEQKNIQPVSMATTLDLKQPHPFDTKEGLST